VHALNEDFVICNKLPIHRLLYLRNSNNLGAGKCPILAVWNFFKPLHFCTYDMQRSRFSVHTWSVAVQLLGAATYKIIQALFIKKDKHILR